MTMEHGILYRAARLVALAEHRGFTVNDRGDRVYFNPRECDSFTRSELIVVVGSTLLSNGVERSCAAAAAVRSVDARLREVAS